MEEKTENTLGKYASGVLAINLLTRKENDKYVKGALDLLAQNLNLSEDARGFIEGSYVNKYSLNTAASIYATMHEENLQGATGNDLANWFEGDVLDGLSDSDKTTLKNRLISHENENYGNISKAYRLAKTKVDAPAGDYSDEEVTSARETIEKYNIFIETYSELFDLKLEELRAKALPFAKKRALESLVKEQ